ncbi:hypothetical protein ACDI110481_18500 [Acinetobacter dispersus]
MWAVRYTTSTVFSFTRYIHFSPTCTCRQDDGFRFKLGTILQFHFNQTIGRLICACDLADTLQVHDIDTVFTNMCFHVLSELRTHGFLNCGEVLNVHGVHHLTAKAFSHDTRFDAFTCRIDCCSTTRRSTTNHQHIECIFGIDCCCIFLS